MQRYFPKGKGRRKRKGQEGPGALQCFAERASKRPSRTGQRGRGNQERVASLSRVFLSWLHPGGPQATSRSGLVSLGNRPERTKIESDSQSQPFPAMWPWANLLCPRSEAYFTLHAENSVRPMCLIYLAPNSHSLNVSSPAPPYSS